MSGLKQVSLSRAKERSATPNDFPIKLDFAGAADSAATTIPAVREGRIKLLINFVQNFQNGHLPVCLHLINLDAGGLSGGPILAKNGYPDYFFHFDGSILFTPPSHIPRPLARNVCLGSSVDEG